MDPEFKKQAEEYMASLVKPEYGLYLPIFTKALTEELRLKSGSVAYEILNGGAPFKEGKVPMTPDQERVLTFLFKNAETIVQQLEHASDYTYGQLRALGMDQKFKEMDKMQTDPDHPVQKKAQELIKSLLS